MSTVHLFKKKVNKEFLDSKSHNPEKRLPIFQGTLKSAFALQHQTKEFLPSEEPDTTNQRGLWGTSTNTDQQNPKTSAVGNYQPSDFVHLLPNQDLVSERRATDPQYSERHTAAIARNPHLPREHISSSQHGLLPHQGSVAHMQQHSSYFSASRSEEIEAMESNEQKKKKHSLRAFDAKDTSVIQNPTPQRFNRKTHDERASLAKSSK